MMQSTPRAQVNSKVRFFEMCNIWRREERKKNRKLSFFRYLLIDGKTHRCRNINERSVKPDLTAADSLEARVFGYMNGESLSTSKRSRGIRFDSKSFRTEFSDLS